MRTTGHARAFLQSLDDESVSLTITDPPWRISGGGTATDAWSSELPVRKNLKGWERGRGWTLGQQATLTDLWPTPTAGDPQRGRRPNVRGDRASAGAADRWPTPTAADERAAQYMNDRGTIRPTLTGAAKSLESPTALGATPTSRDWKDGDGTANVPTRSHLGRQAPRTTTLGSESSPLAQTSRRPSRVLNPAFVEWLMGFPFRWTEVPSQTVQADCGPSVMPSSRKLQRSSRGASSKSRKKGGT